jgi:hypothetical protein
MHRWAFFVAIVGACGSTPPPQPVERPTTRVDGSPDRICARLTALHDEHCGIFTDLELDAASCPRNFRAAQEQPPSSARLAMRRLGRCVAENAYCQETLRCVEGIDHFRVKPLPPAPSAAVACERIHGPLARCGFNYGRDRGSCAQLFDEHPSLLSKSGHCVVEEGDDCDHVVFCIQESTFDKSNLRACSDDEPGKAAGLLQADWRRRNGAGVTELAAARSSKAAPIEVCGFIAENEWLFAATCQDGSHPIMSRSQAESARVGNVGPGGRCGSIVDRYRIACPEETYDIYIDGYVCPLAE